MYPDSNDQIPAGGSVASSSGSLRKATPGRESTVGSGQKDLYVAAHCVASEASEEQSLYAIIWRPSLYFDLTVVLT